MMIKKAGELADKYLAERHIMQLATTAGNKPWICTVYYVHDEDRNLYWASLPSRRHSRELAQNPKVAAAIAYKGVIGEKVIGIQVEGSARELELPLADRAMVERYAAKFSRDQQWIEDFVAGKTGHRFYKLTPASMVLFDEEHFPDDPQQELL
jgi:uncharacterized protein YhbP (UPF0306 family)